MYPTFIQAYEHLPHGLQGNQGSGYGLAKLQHGWSIFVSTANSNIIAQVMKDSIDGKSSINIASNKSLNYSGGQASLNLASRAKLVNGDGFYLSTKVRFIRGTGYTPNPVQFQVGSTPISLLSQQFVTNSKSYQLVELIVGKGMTNVPYQVYIDKKLVRSGLLGSAVYASSIYVYYSYPVNNSNGHTWAFEAYYRDLVIMKGENGEDIKPIPGLTIVRHTPAWMDTSKLFQPPVIVLSPSGDTPQQILARAPIQANGFNSNNFFSWYHNNPESGTSTVEARYSGFLNKKVMGVWPITQAAKTSNDNAFLPTRLMGLTDADSIVLTTDNLALPANTANNDSNNPTYGKNWAGDDWTHADMVNLRYVLHFSPAFNIGVKLIHASLYVVYSDINENGIVTGKNGLDSVKDLIDAVANPDISQYVEISVPTLLEETVNGNNTRITIQAMIAANYRGDYDLYYTRREVIDIIPYNFTLPTDVGNSYELIPILNAQIGIVLEESDFELTQRVNNRITLIAAATSFFLIPGSEVVV